MVLSELTPLLFLEGIIVLLICLVMVTLFLMKQRSLVKKLQSKYIDLYRHQTAIESVESYFTRSIKETRDRFEKLTHSNTVIFSPTSSYSEKVVALRYLYLNLEQEAEIIKKSNNPGWKLYEDKLELLLNLLRIPQFEQQQEKHDITTPHSLMELTEYKTESKLVIKRLKDILASVKNSVTNTPIVTLSSEYKEILESMASNENVKSIRNLLNELKIAADTFETRQSKRIENSINTLEYEVESSDQSLNKMKINSEQGSVDISEINKLKESYTTQKGVIYNLEHEISILRGSINKNTSQEVKDNKEVEIVRLERVVKEYEGCVAILENHIDDLYDKLKTTLSQEPTPPDSELDSAQDISNELQQMTQKLDRVANDYRQAVALNRAIYAFGQCKTIKEIASSIVKLVKEFNIQVGFNIQSAVGKADYFPPLLFNDSLKRLVKNAAQQTHIGKVNGNSVFFSYGIKIMLFQSENDSDAINSTLSGLTCVASENIRRLENSYTLDKSSSHIDGWASIAKSKIANIDVQFSYQAEENKRIYEQFILELRKSFPQLDLQNDGAIMLDKAINEYELRMELLLSNSDVVNRELSKLVSHISALKLQIAKQTNT